MVKVKTNNNLGVHIDNVDHNHRLSSLSIEHC